MSDLAGAAGLVASDRATGEGMVHSRRVESSRHSLPSDLQVASHWIDVCQEQQLGA